MTDHSAVQHSQSLNINPAPIVALPAGITTARRPLVAWRMGDGAEACRVRITRGDSPSVQVVFDSDDIVLGEMSCQVANDLPVGETLFAWVRLRRSGAWSEWSARRAPFRIEPIVPAQGPLATFDLHYTRRLTPQLAFEHAHLVAALQGIVNRTAPRLHVDFVEADVEPARIDTLWFDRLRAPGAWLSAMTLEPIAGIAALVEKFRADIKGVVVWDPAVPATSNVASTIAGIEDLLPICMSDAPDSLYHQLILSGPRLPVVRNLSGLFSQGAPIPGTARPSTGSAKCDAYVWALEHYLKSGKCDPRHLAYYMDAWWIRDPRPGKNWQNHTLTNHDYFIAQRAFFFDLSPWGDEQPIDDPAQPAGLDLEIFLEILRAAHDARAGREMIMMGGFTPWAFKYTDFRHESGYCAGGKHGGVQTEWEHVRICSAYNVYLDADALHLSAIANASLTQHMPLPERFAQPLPPMPDELRHFALLDGDGRVAPKNYIMHYVGDYDAAAWTMNALPLFWRKPGRGSAPMCWSVNPNLALRARPMFWWFFETRTANDHLIAGDCGAGYINATQMFPPRDPSGLPGEPETFQRHCAPWYQRFDINYTGFLIQGRAGNITPEAERLYLPFSVNGVMVQYERWTEPLHLQDRMPVFVLECDIGHGIETDARMIVERLKSGAPNFLMFRSVLKSPEYYLALNEEVEKLAAGKFDIEFCSADDMAYLARVHLGSHNNRLATYLFAAMPERVAASESIEIEIAVRNDGWNKWKAEGIGAMQMGVEITPQGEWGSPLMLDIPHDVAPGDCAVIAFQIAAPAAPGCYTLRAEMSCECRKPGWFSATGDAPMRAAIIIT